MAGRSPEVSGQRPVIHVAPHSQLERVDRHHLGNHAEEMAHRQRDRSKKKREHIAVGERTLRPANSAVRSMKLTVRLRMAMTGRGERGSKSLRSTAKP